MSAGFAQCVLTLIVSSVRRKGGCEVRAKSSGCGLGSAKHADRDLEHGHAHEALEHEHMHTNDEHHQHVHASDEGSELYRHRRPDVAQPLAFAGLAAPTSSLTPCRAT